MPVPNVTWQLTNATVPLGIVAGVSHTRRRGRRDRRDRAMTTTNLTELVFIVDRSGSMGGLESDTIGGLNATLNKNRAAEGDAIVSIVLFDNVSEVIVDRKDIREVSPLTERDYSVRGCTALLDAVGDAIHYTAKVQGYMPQGHKADHVVFAIITDGQENASNHRSYDEVKRMIEEKTAQGWEFLFLGANIDAAAEAGRMGIRADRAANYVADGAGSSLAYEAIADAQVALRDSGTIDAAWAAAPAADAARRAPKRRGGFFRR